MLAFSIARHVTSSEVKTGITDTNRFPVEMVSWDDCQEFLKKLDEKKIAARGKGKFCLPHENEWELAARGGKGNKQPFYFGDELNGKQENCDGNDPYGTATKGPHLERTTAVGSYEVAAPHPWGLCDMSGNVWQLCENKYDNENNLVVVRGGSCEKPSEFLSLGPPQRLGTCRPRRQYRLPSLFPHGRLKTCVPGSPKPEPNLRCAGRCCSRTDSRKLDSGRFLGRQWHP